MSETIPSTPDRETTSESVDPAREMGSRAVHVVCPRCQRESSQTLNPTASPQDARQESVADMSYAVVSEPTDVGDDEETETSPPVVLKDVDRDQLSKDIALVRRELAKASELPPAYRRWQQAIKESNATFVDDPPIVPYFVDED
jgi:hypothetical protein